MAALPPERQELERLTALLEAIEERTGIILADCLATSARRCQY